MKRETFFIGLVISFCVFYEYKDRIFSPYNSGDFPAYLVDQSPTSKGCVLGGSDAKPMSGAAATEVRTEGECIRFCEDSIIRGVAEYPAWRDKAYNYRCAFGGKFIHFRNRAPKTSNSGFKDELPCKFGPPGETPISHGSEVSEEKCLVLQ